MNPAEIWWGQIGSSLRLLDKLTGRLREHNSFILHLPQELPWRRDFYEAVDLRRAAFSGERRLRRLAWEGHGDPGGFVLDELCSDKVRADYWPGQSYAAYLGSRGDILLCDYDVWITGLHTKADLMRWVEFATEYARCGQALEAQAVFVLEYDGPPAEAPGLDCIPYSVEDYDCRVFSLEAATALGNTGLRTYQAELALSLSGCDPEFCSALLNAGNRLLLDPVPTAMSMGGTALSSTGMPFPQVSGQQAASAAWEAALVQLFPILERFRMSFINKNKGELSRHLPISNSNGDRITDPCDLDIGPLYYMASTVSNAFSPAVVDALRLCRRVRNLLAHNKEVSYQDVERVFALVKDKALLS